MKFNTTLNDGAVTVEYEADTSDGSVWECEVMYQGKIITATIDPAKYWAFLIDCEAHYKAHAKAEQLDYSMFRAECADVEIGRAAA